MQSEGGGSGAIDGLSGNAYSEISTTHSSGSINLPEWLTELRKTSHLQDYQFIIKGCNSGKSMKRCTGQALEKGAQIFPTLDVPLSLTLHMFIHQPGSSQNPVLLGLYGGFITKA